MYVIEKENVCYRMYVIKMYVIDKKNVCYTIYVIKCML